MKSIYENYHNPFFRGWIALIIVKVISFFNHGIPQHLQTLFSNKRREAFAIAEEIYKG
jgi:hypothetical protein